MSIQKRLVIALIIALIVVIVLLVTRQGSDERGLRAAFDAEFLSRPDGYRGLIEHYDFEFPSPPRQMDPGLMYKALASGTIDVIDGFATDGRIPAYNLVTLKDDENFFPPYEAAPVLRVPMLDRYPQIKEILNILALSIDNKTMQQLNYQADEEGLKADKVARRFLEKRGLLKTEPKTPKKKYNKPIVVGGKHFTEQEILGEIFAILLKNRSNIPVKKKLNIGGTMICFNAIRSGDIDLYPEYSGTALMNILKQRTIVDPDTVYSIVKHEFLEQYGLVWLKPLGFNNTYTLTMRKDQAKKLGISTISDLAEYIREHN